MINTVNIFKLGKTMGIRHGIKKWSYYGPLLITFGFDLITFGFD